MTREPILKLPLLLLLVWASLERAVMPPFALMIESISRRCAAFRAFRRARLAICSSTRRVASSLFLTSFSFESTSDIVDDDRYTSDIFNVRQAMLATWNAMRVTGACYQIRTTNSIAFFSFHSVIFVVVHALLAKILIQHQPSVLRGESWARCSGLELMYLFVLSLVIIVKDR